MCSRGVAVLEDAECVAVLLAGVAVEIGGVTVVVGPLLMDDSIFNTEGVTAEVSGMGIGGGGGGGGGGDPGGVVLMVESPE